MQQKIFGDYDLFKVDCRFVTSDEDHYNHHLMNHHDLSMPTRIEFDESVYNYTDPIEFKRIESEEDIAIARGISFTMDKDINWKILMAEEKLSKEMLIMNILKAEKNRKRSDNNYISKFISEPELTDEFVKISPIVSVVVHSLLLFDLWETLDLRLHLFLLCLSTLSRPSPHRQSSLSSLSRCAFYSRAPTI